MDKNVAYHMARNLMDKHGLGSIPLVYDRSKSRMGITYWRQVEGVWLTTKIGLSSYWTEARPPAEVEATVLHEIAHALTPGHKHDAVWRAKARSLGISSDRCASPSAEAKAKMETLAPAAWKGECPQGHSHGMHRKPVRVQLCGLCKGVHTPKRVIVWSNNGRVMPPESFGPKYRADMSRVAKM